MKRNFRKLFAIFLLGLTCLSMMVTVCAEAAPSTMTMNSYKVDKTPVDFPATFRAKKASDGRYVFCAYYAKKPPISSIKYTRGTVIEDAGVQYILNKAYGIKDDTSFFVYQSALWVYMIDKGIMKAPYDTLTTFKSQLSKDNSETAKKIKQIVAEAKGVKSINKNAPTIKVDTTNAKFVLDNGYYVSEGIVVTSSTGSYEAQLTNAPEGTTITKNGNKLTIKVPNSKITALKTGVSFKVSNSKNIYTTYNYNPSDSKYQIMYATYKEVKSASATGSLSIEKTASIDVIKVDATSKKTVAGAELQIVNSNGTVIDKWTSTTSAHTVKGLKEGTYTLKETKAPNGYKLSGVETKFTVGADGKVKNSSGSVVTKIEYTNSKTSVSISKQDITSKAELPGATLVVKDSNGQQIKSWESTDKPYIIEGLTAGTYTLTETIAPEGYVLSTETITFRIDEKGNLVDANGNKISHVVMYNKKQVYGEVTISKQDITTGKEIKDAHLVVKDSNGNVIDEWTSVEGKSHTIKNLKPGTYTLTETVAPEGYVLSKETITFKIDEKGNLVDKDGNKITHVVMYNKPEEVFGGATISKQDITNGKEIAGAHLVVKDYDGNVIEEWVSVEGKSHLIENLKPGIYTLTETIAPEGYVLSEEVITFTVKEDGSITKVVMYNSPSSKDIPVESTSSFKSVISSVMGIIIMLAGSVILVRTKRKIL